MKRLFFILTLCVLLAPLVTQAQTPLYLIPVDSLSGTGVTTTAKAALGYDVFKDIKQTENMPIRELTDIQIRFTKTTDSVSIFGGRVDFGTDTVWTPLELKIKLKLAGVYALGLTLPPRDTTVAKWVSPYYTTGFWGATPTIDMTQHNYAFYRVASGLNDSGKTYILPVKKLRPGR